MALVYGRDWWLQKHVLKLFPFTKEQIEEAYNKIPDGGGDQLIGKVNGVDCYISKLMKG